MGCGVSRTVAVEPDTPPEATERVAILCRCARGLPEVNGEKVQDPYISLRIGGLGTTYAAKDALTERQSHVVYSDNSPTWDFIAFIDMPRTNLAEAELHVLVKDCDLFSAHDLLGEVRVPMADLQQHSGTEREYALQSEDSKIEACAMLTIALSGPETALAQSFASMGSLDDDASTGGHALSFLSSVGSYYARRASDLWYYVNMLRFAMTGSHPDGGIGWFRKQSRERDGSMADVSIVGFPSTSATTYIGHQAVHSRLSSFGAAYGTNNADGSVARANFLGMQELNRDMWPELSGHPSLGEPAIAIGATQEHHAFVRPYLDRLLGPVRGRWTHASVQQMADSFWERRQRLVVKEDVALWCFKVLHSVHLNMDLADEEVRSFAALQRKLLIGIGIPPSVVGNRLVREQLGIDAALAEKEQWIARYESALCELFPQEAAQMTRAQLTLLASTVMDSLLFAGGQSVQTVICMAVALLVSDKGVQTVLPADFRLTEANMLQFVLETIRMFPPVGTFSYTERTVPPTKTFLYLLTAMKDEQAWGGDAQEFVLRPLEAYAKLSVAWADPAIIDGDNGAPNSRVCPGKDLSLAMVTSFLLGLLHRTVGVDDAVAGTGFDRRQWAVTIAEGSKGKKVDWNGYGLKGQFVLDLWRQVP